MSYLLILLSKSLKEQKVFILIKPHLIKFYQSCFCYRSKKSWPDPKKLRGVIDLVIALMLGMFMLMYKKLQRFSTVFVWKFHGFKVVHLGL